MKSFYYNYPQDISIANVWIKGGSSQEKIEKKGINQILIALLTRGCKGYTNYSFSDALDSYGAELNYEACEDGISLCLKSLSEYFNELYPLLILILEEPNLHENEFNQCKRLALNSVIKLKENLYNITFENLKKIIFSDQSYKFGCMGNEESINKITYKNLLDEYTNFKSRRKFLITNYKLNNLIDLNYLKFENKNLERLDILNHVDSESFICHYTNSKQIILMIGNQTCPHGSKDHLPLKILESYLSFGMSSLLFRIFREKNGLTYDSGVIYPTKELNAPFLIYLSFSEKNASEAFEMISKIWRDLISKSISNDEIHLAKIKLKSSILHDYQSLESITTRKVKLLGLKLNPFYDEDSIKEIDNITSEEVLRVSKKYFKKLYISLSGNRTICRRLIDTWNKNF